MSSNFHNPFATNGASRAAGSDADETLRLIAGLPAPEGLEDRIHEVLRSAPRRGQLLSWPRQPFARHDWMRAAAAAAIAFVVVGGGWGVYSRVQQGQPAMPAHVAAPGGFSGAGAIRTPQTLNGPVLAQTVRGKTPKKTGAHKSVPPGTAGKTATQAPSAK
jgi:hypothetical protein